MYKRLTVCLMHLLVKNVVYLSLIYLNIVIHFYRLSALSITKTLQTKCPSSSISLDSYKWQLNRISDQLIKELTLNYSHVNSDRLVWKRRKRHSLVSEYMTGLYRSQPADNNRLKYNAKTIASIANSDTPLTKSPFHFFFNLSETNGFDEHIIEAEFHIFKLKSEPKSLNDSDAKQRRSGAISVPKHNLLEVKVYQILNKERTINRLLDVRRMSTHSLGWDVFYIKPAVIDWLRNHTTNYGLSISVTTLLGEDVKHGIRFVKRSHKHSNKQPIIVIFSSDRSSDQNKSRLQPDNSKYDYGFTELDSNERNPEESQSKPNKLDASDGPVVSSWSLQPSDPSNACLKREVYIEMDGFDWSAPIIYPKGLTITSCEGQCDKQVNRYSYARSVATHPNATLLDRFYSIEKRCCIANTFSPFNVLYFDERGNVVLKSIGDLIINGCACLPFHSSH